MRRTAAITLASMLLSASTAWGVEVKGGEAPTLNIKGFAQPRVDAVVSSDDVVSDFYVRRTRLLVLGRAHEHVGYFVGFLAADLGREGNDRVTPWIADAWLEGILTPELSLHAGVMRMPFSRHMAQGGGTIHGIDFHGALMRRRGPLPQQTADGPVPRAPLSGRDLGVMARGQVFDGKLDIRLAVADGVSPHGQTHWPRVVGRVALHGFDPEPGFHLAGTYLGKKRVLTFGASVDVEPGVGGASGDDPYYAFSVDMLADIPFGSNGLTSTLAAYYYGPGGAMQEGAGFWADLGYRLGALEPLGELELYEPLEGDAGERLALYGGINWWYGGHNASVKLRSGGVRTDGARYFEKRIEVQGQVAF